MYADRVLVWGIGKGYQRICNALRWNEKLGNFEILAYISRDNAQKSFDGKEVIRPEQIQDKYGENFDYIIVSTEDFFREIVMYGAETLNIDRNRFLRGKVLEIPCFDWKRYIEIYKSNISIVAEFCYGGILSHHLGLPFCSPFVNVRVSDKMGYQQMINRLDYYMSIPPTIKEIGMYKSKNWMIREGHVEYPLLWYDNIVLHGFHYKSEEDFLLKWEQRRKRYNLESRVVFKIIYNERDLDDFDKLAIDNKVGLYFGNTENGRVITIPFDRRYYAYSFATCVHEFVETGVIFDKVDIFKLLMGEKDFKR